MFLAFVAAFTPELPTSQRDRAGGVQDMGVQLTLCTIYICIYCTHPSAPLLSAHALVLRAGVAVVEYGERTWGGGNKLGLSVKLIPP